MGAISMLIRSLLFVALITSATACNSDDDSNGKYLDIYILSIMSDVRNYVLALEFSDGKNVDQEDLLRNALEMKYYDLQRLLDQTTNAKVIETICLAENTVRDNAIKVSNNCAGELCVEIEKLDKKCEALTVE